MKDREAAWAEDMRAGCGGDERAYARVLGELAAVLRSVIRRRLAGWANSQTDAEDVVQDVLLAIHTKRMTWDQTRPLMPWIWAVVEHKVIDGARRRKRGSRFVPTDMTADDLGELFVAPEPELDASGIDVERHLATLSKGQRRVVRALTVDGLSIAAVARETGMSEGAVRVALHRGLAALARRAADLGRASIETAGRDRRLRDRGVPIAGKKS